MEAISLSLIGQVDLRAIQNSAYEHVSINYHLGLYTVYKKIFLARQGNIYKHRLCAEQVGSWHFLEAQYMDIY